MMSPPQLSYAHQKAAVVVTSSRKTFYGRVTKPSWRISAFAELRNRK